MPAQQLGGDTKPSTPFGIVVAEPLLFAALLQMAFEGHPTDQALMKRVASRDASALEQLYDRHSRVVYAVLIRMTEQAASADELLQDVFLRLWNSAARYESVRGPLTPWLLTLARNIAIDHLRSKGEKQRRQEQFVDPAPMPASEPPMDDWIDHRRLAADLHQRMAELPDTQRKALDLAYFKGLSHSEIASALGEPLGTVKTWIRNAVLHLRREMREDT